MFRHCIKDEWSAWSSLFFFFWGGGGGYLCSNEETNSGLTDGILTQTPAMPVQCYQLRFQANWELLVMWVDLARRGWVSIYIYIHDFHASTKSYKIVVICYSKFL